MRLQLKIYGSVQGVVFRDSTKEKADALNVKGWIKNNSDGTVEAVFEGEKGKLLQMLEFCKSGPSSAVVDKVEEKWSDLEEFNEFKVVY